MKKAINLIALILAAILSICIIFTEPGTEVKIALLSLDNTLLWIYVITSVDFKNL